MKKSKLKKLNKKQNKKLKSIRKQQDAMDTIVRTIEEMAELTKVLSKYLKRSKKFNINKLTEELAHVMLMSKAIMEIFDIDKKKLKKEKLDTWEKALGRFITSNDIKKMKA